MSLLYLLESIRTPFLDTIMSAITHLGGETVFMVIAVAVFWCVKKEYGYYLLCGTFLGTVINQTLKLTFRISRPWVADPDFMIVESAREGASGYSFPSGHTQNAVATFGGVARFSKHGAVRAVCIVLAALTAFSRMYLGVHTMLDVGVSLIVSVILVFALYPLFRRSGDNPRIMYISLSVMLALSVGYTLYTELNVWPADIDAENLASGVKNGYTMAGAVLGMLIAYRLDVKYIHFPTAAPLWAQGLKLLAGLGATLAIRVALKAPLLMLFSGHNIAHSVRYFIMILFAAALWPLTFRWFSRGCKRQ